MRNHKRATVWLVFLLLWLLSGCSAYPKDAGRMVVWVNRENIKNLEIGYSKSAVFEIMGRPQQTADFPRYAKHLHYWKYQTTLMPNFPHSGMDEYFTYLAFEGDTLVGMGAGHEVIPLNNKHPLWKPQ